MLKYILEHRVTVISIILMLLFISLVSISKLPVELFPRIEYPAFEVLIKTTPHTTDFTEKKVAKAYLEAFQDIDNLLYVKRIISPTYCLFILKFKWNTDLDAAYLKIKEALNKVELKHKYIHDIVKEIKITEKGANGAPFMAFILPERLREFISNELVFKLGSLDGIGRVEIVGEKIARYRLVYTPENLFKYGYRPTNEFRAIYFTIKYPLHLRLKEGEREYPLVINSPLNSLEDVRLLPVDNIPVYKYFHFQKIKPAEKVLYNGEKFIAIFLYPSSSGSPLHASKEVRKILKSLHVQYKILFDNSQFLKDTLKSLTLVLIYGILFAILSSFLFLGNVRAGFIVGTSIPLSVLFSFIFIYLAGYSLNIITLGALIMASGMLIDASLIVLESIQDEISNTPSYKKAVLTGTKKVKSAVVSSMLTNSIVFVPVVFIYGLAGKLFIPFSTVVIVSTLLALFISLSVVPMLAYIFKIPSTSSLLTIRSAEFFKKSFSFVNRHRKALVFTIAIFSVLSIYSAFSLKLTLFPQIESKRIRVKILDFSRTKEKDIYNRAKILLKKHEGVLVKKDRGIQIWTLYLYDVNNRRAFDASIKKMFPDMITEIKDLDNPLSYIFQKLPALQKTSTEKVVKLQILPQKARAFGIDISQIFRIIKAVSGYTNLGYIDTIKLEKGAYRFKNLDEILSLPVENQKHTKIPLRKLVSIDSTTYKSVASSIWPSEQIPKRESKRTYISVLQAIIFASLLVLLAIIAVFESAEIASVAIWQIPLTLAFATITLVMLKRSLDIITGIGIVVLAGVSVNDAIVLLDFILKEQLKPQPVLNAIEKRTRSILATTVTTFMGLLPLLLSTSQGARIQHGMAIVLISGLLFSTFTSMTVIPVLYLAARKLYDKNR